MVLTKETTSTQCLLLLVFKSRPNVWYSCFYLKLPPSLSVSWGVGYGFRKMMWCQPFHCDQSQYAFFCGMLAGALRRCHVFRQLRLLEVLAVTCRNARSQDSTEITHLPAFVSCVLVACLSSSRLVRVTAVAWDKLFDLFVLPEDIPRHLVTYMSCEAQIRQMLAVEGSPLRQKVHGMGVWLKTPSLAGCGPASCSSGQLSSMASSPSWAPGSRDGGRTPCWCPWYSKVNSWGLWRRRI